MLHLLRIETHPFAGHYPHSQLLASSTSSQAWDPFTCIPVETGTAILQTPMPTKTWVESPGPARRFVGFGAPLLFGFGVPKLLTKRSCPVLSEGESTTLNTGLLLLP